jgi:hypothetical protein
VDSEDGVGDKRERVETAAREATNSGPARVLARGGLVASGVVHVLIGAIAISVTRGLRGRADQSGALDAVADVPGGTIVLWVAVVALLGLAAWQWTGPISPRPERMVPTKVRDRFKAVGFVAVALAALVFAAGGHSDSAKSAHTVSSWLIQLPGGIFVLMAVGIAVGSVGGTFVFRGISQHFREDIHPPPGAAGVAVLTLGVVGYTAKGLALVIIGVLFVGGALVGDPSWTTGLDGALRYLTTLPTGVWPLFFIGGGFIAHGLYQGCRAVYMRR